MLVEINYQAPDKCSDCKFRLSGSGDFGRTNVFVCLLTGIGDSTSEGSGDENRAERRMREDCPFL